MRPSGYASAEPPIRVRRRWLLGGFMSLGRNSFAVTWVDTSLSPE